MFANWVLVFSCYVNFYLFQGGKRVVCGDGEGVLGVFAWGLWGDVIDRWDTIGGSGGVCMGSLGWHYCCFAIFLNNHSNDVQHIMHLEFRLTNSCMAIRLDICLKRNDWLRSVMSEVVRVECVFGDQRSLIMISSANILLRLYVIITFHHISSRLCCNLAMRIHKPCTTGRRCLRSPHMTIQKWDRQERNGRKRNGSVSPKIRNRIN